MNSSTMTPILVGLLCAISCLAQPAVIGAGANDRLSAAASVLRTTHSLGGEPLAGVRITVHPLDGAADRAATSGADGAFTVTGLMPGRYELQASKDGFTSPAGKTVELAANENLNANIDFQDTLKPGSAPPAPPVVAPAEPPA